MYAIFEKGVNFDYRYRRSYLVSSRAMFYVQEYALSHSMMLADALIAATVIQNSEVLVTANDRHYTFIPNIECTKFSPGTV